MEKPKVLIFSDCYIYGGSERLMAFLLKNENVLKEFDLTFAFRRHKDYVAGLQKDFEKFRINVDRHPLLLLSNETLFHKINCTQFPYTIKLLSKLPFLIFQCLGIYFLFNCLTFIIFIKKARPAIVHINNGGYPGARSCNQFVLSAKLCGVNAIVYQVNNIAYKTKNALVGFYDRLIGKYVKSFITASARASDALARERKFDEKKITRIPNTIVLEKITKTRREILESVKWDDHSFLLVQVAFLTERKGQINLIKAVQQIIEEGNIKRLSETIRLMLVGNGEDERMLKAYVKENNLDNMVHFTGYTSDSVSYINASDIFVLPSIANEDMPLSLLTAMSCGKTVLASRFAGIAEAVADGQNGSLIDYDQATMVKELKNKIIELYSSPDLKEKMGEAAAQTFKERFSEKIYGERINNLYRKALL